MAADGGTSEPDLDKPKDNISFKLIYSINGFVSSTALVSAPTEKRQRLTAGFGALRIHGPGELNMYASPRSARPADIEDANETVIRGGAAQQTKPENEERIGGGELTADGAHYVNELRGEPVAAEGNAQGGFDHLPSFEEAKVASVAVCARFWEQVGSGFDAFCGAAAAAAAHKASLDRQDILRVPLHEDASIDFASPLMMRPAVDMLARSPSGGAASALNEACSAEDMAAVREWEPAAAAQELQDTLHGNVWNAWFAEDVGSMRVTSVLGLSDNGSNRFCTSVFVMFTERRVYLLDLYAP